MKRKKISPEDVEKYLELLPSLVEYAQSVADEALEEAVELIVYSEISDDQEAEEYIESLQVVKINSDKRMVKFHPINSRIASLETGVKPFSIKEKMLNSPKAKMSKDGFLYRTVPLSRSATSEPKTEKGREILEKIRETIKGSNFAFQFAKDFPEKNQFVVQDRAKNVIRKRVFKSEEEYKKKQKPLSKEYVIFRTMSSRPGTSNWFHPGTSGKNLEGKVNQWLLDNEARIFEEAFNELFEMAFGR